MSFQLRSAICMAGGRPGKTTSGHIWSLPCNTTPSGAQCSEHNIARGSVSPCALCTVLQMLLLGGRQTAKTTIGPLTPATANQVEKSTLIECLCTARTVPVAPMQSSRSTSKFLGIIFRSTRSQSCLVKKGTDVVHIAHRREHVKGDVIDLAYHCTPAPLHQEGRSTQWPRTSR